LGASPCGVRNKDMTLNILKRLEVPLRHASCVVFAWMGEPLLNPELPQMIRYVKSLGTRTHITTNGFMLDKNKCQSIIDSGIDSIAISINAATDELYEEIMIGGNLKRVKNNIFELNKILGNLPDKKPTLEISSVITPKNILTFPEMIKMLAELNIRKTQIAPVDDYGCPDKFKINEKSVFGDKNKARHYIEKGLSLAKKLGIQVDFSDPYRMLYEIGKTLPEQDYQFQTNFNAQDIIKSKIRKQCPIPWNHSVIAENGDVHPCGISEQVMGNINQEPYEKIWFGRKFKDFRTKLLENQPPKECFTCRRVQWVKPRPLSMVTNQMQINKKEFHGQGWQNCYKTWRRDAYRHMGHTSTFFLKYNRENWLVLTIGSINKKNISGIVCINDIRVGDYHVNKKRQRVFYRIPLLNTSLIKVTISGQPADFKLIFYKGGLRKSKPLSFPKDLWNKTNLKLKQ